MVAPIVITPSVNRQFTPVEILRRIPGAVIQSANASIESFVQTAGVMVPAGLIWKFSILRSSGVKPWIAEGGK